MPDIWERVYNDVYKSCIVLLILIGELVKMRVILLHFKLRMERVFCSLSEFDCAWKRVFFFMMAECVYKVLLLHNMQFF